MTKLSAKPLLFFATRFNAADSLQSLAATFAAVIDSRNSPGPGNITNKYVWKIQNRSEFVLRHKFFRPKLC